jgi:hypothetical protein
MNDLSSEPLQQYFMSLMKHTQQKQDGLEFRKYRRMRSTSKLRCTRLNYLWLMIVLIGTSALAVIGESIRGSERTTADQQDRDMLAITIAFPDFSDLVSVPDLSPTAIPSDMPSLAPSDVPSLAPSDEPSLAPSDAPSLAPSDAPSLAPSDAPSLAPSDAPSLLPSDAPSLLPSGVPSSIPSDQPSLVPEKFIPNSEPVVGNDGDDDTDDDLTFISAINTGSAAPVTYQQGSGFVFLLLGIAAVI